MVPSTLHICVKYIKDDEVYRIDGEIQPFGMHEIHYDDARYFIGTLKGGRLFAAKDDALMKISITTKLTQERVSFLPLKPHFGSDTKPSEEERDDGDMETTYPPSHIKEASILVVMILMEKELHSCKLKKLMMMMMMMMRRRIQ